MREIYLSAFETAVKKARPWMVVCSYNQVNGIYASENKHLLTKILKEEWAHSGLVVTDWGAANDRVAGLSAGEELEMPYSGGENDAKIISGVRSGRLSEDQLENAVTRILKLIVRCLPALKTRGAYSLYERHQLARKIAAQSMALLKNKGVLPLKKEKSLAVIGAFTKRMRCQGGSSMIVPTMLDSVYDALKSEKIEFTYLKGDDPDEALIAEAVRVAKKAEQVVVLAGLPDGYESEGFDRPGLDMPKCQDYLVQRLADVCEDRLAVVLLCGSPIAFKWGANVNAILCAYLGVAR